MCGTQQEGWRFPGGSQEAPVRRYASKIPPFCEEVFWILCPNCKPWHSRQESANFDRGGGFAVGRWSRFGPAQGGSCEVGSRPVPGGGAVGYCVPFEWSRLFRCLGAQRPGGPPARRGPHFSREMGRKRAGGKPPGPPFFMARSFPLAGFGVVGRSEAMLRLFRSPCTCPDLGRFFCVGLHNPEASPWGEAVTEGDG